MLLGMADNIPDLGTNAALVVCGDIGGKFLVDRMPPAQIPDSGPTPVKAILQSMLD